MFLEDWELDAVHFIERHHNVTGGIPSDNDILEYLTITKKYPGVKQLHIDTLKENTLFKSSMLSRGINLNKELTPQQMAAASIMLNLTDRRSDEKKLRDIGVSTEQYRTWMQNSTFAEYMRSSSEQLVANSIHEAHLGLLRGVKQGNTASIKLYYELTGRYNPNEENNINIRMVIGRVLEAIQKHVQNPEVLNSLAVELSQIAIESSSPPVANNNVISLESTRKEIL